MTSNLISPALLDVEDVEGEGELCGPVGDGGAEMMELEVSVKVLEANDVLDSELAAGGVVVGVSPGAVVAGVIALGAGVVLVEISLELETVLEVLLKEGTNVVEDSAEPGGGTVGLDVLVTTVSVAVCVAEVVTVDGIEEAAPQSLAVTVTVEMA